MPPPRQTHWWKHYILRLSIRPFVCYQTSEQDILKTKEPRCMGMKQSTLGVTRSKVVSRRNRSQLENLLDRMSREWRLHQLSKSNIGIKWPWPKSWSLHPLAHKPLVSISFDHHKASVYFHVRYGQTIILGLRLGLMLRVRVRVGLCNVCNNVPGM